MVVGNLQSGVFGTPRQCLSADANSDIGMSIKRPRHISMNMGSIGRTRVRRPKPGLDGRIQPALAVGVSIGDKLETF